MTTAKSMLMPTAMKNRPSSSPLNGSRSVSSWRRYSLSASSTPARKAPSAIDRPTACISDAVATTSSRLAAVKISGVPLRAIQRSAGRSSNRPPKMMASTMPTALAAVSQPLPPAATACCTASKGSSVMTMMPPRSWNSATLRMLRPPLVGIRLRSARVDRAMAVELCDSARPATSASCQRRPAASATAAINTVEPSSCTLPQPKIGRRSDHSRLGSSSRPTRNSISTTPNSAKCRMSVGSDTSFSTPGPIRMPAAR
jgi:hypothetical protein